MSSLTPFERWRHLKVLSCLHRWRQIIAKQDADQNDDKLGKRSQPRNGTSCLLFKHQELLKKVTQGMSQCWSVLSIVWQINLWKTIKVCLSLEGNKRDLNQLKLQNENLSVNRLKMRFRRIFKWNVDASTSSAWEKFLWILLARRLIFFITLEISNDDWAPKWFDLSCKKARASRN